MYNSKKCFLCGAIFRPTSGKQKYCKECLCIKKKEWDRKTDRKEHYYQERRVRCKICGKEFTTFYKRKNYCGSEECEKIRCRLKNKRYEAKRSEVLKLKTIVRKEANRIKNIEFIRSYISQFGYHLVDAQDFKSSHRGKLHLRCPEGHDYFCTFHAFKDNGTRCVVCYTKGNFVSRPEASVWEFLRDNYSDLIIIRKDRTQIYPYELDLFFPQNMLAVEICGLYWHGELSSGKPPSYHYDKMIKCYEKGIRLITIFEDELRGRFDVVMSRVVHALSRTPSKINARDCVVSEITLKEAYDFFDKNHLQGSTNIRKAFGLFYNGFIVQAVGLGSSSRKHTTKDGIIELKREASIPFYSIRGGMSKLFKEVINYCKSIGAKGIKSYADMRYSNPFISVYEKLGFRLIGSTKYTPHYIKDGIRYRNQTLRKKGGERLLNKTEWDIRRNQGYDRIWDCGHKTYIFYFNGG